MYISENKKVIIYIIVAFIFSFTMRLIWVYQFNDISEFKFNDQFMINTNDGYYWAEGARDIINGITNPNSNSPILSATSQLTAVLYKYLPFSFETIIFYMPLFFSSLLVIPIVLIGNSLNKVEIGFIAALVASIAWSYYNRTMAGYYDTDFLNIVFPTVLLWSIIGGIKSKEDKYLLFIAIDILLYRWWYPQSYSLEFAFFILVSFYLLFEVYKNKNNSNKLYENKEVFYTIQLLSLMILAMVQLELTLRLMLIFGYFMLFRQERWHKHLYIMFVMVMILFISSGGLNPIIGKLKSYLFQEIVSTTGEDLILHYFTVMQTIKEASTIDLNHLANRISGSAVVFICSFIGYLWLCIRNPIMLFGLPMLGLGLLSYSGGLRFTIYAVPILSLGIGYLIIEISSYIKAKSLKVLFIFVTTLVSLYPNMKHIIEYRIPPVFLNQEVSVLDDIKKMASREDYVISWWDYGYPIRYYSDVKTLSDGSKHSGDINFPISFAFLEDQNRAAKMLRLDVEYTEKGSHLDKEYKSRYKTNLENMIYDYSYSDANKFLDSLHHKIVLPKKTRDIYIYLPYKMLDILPTISTFSNIDLMTGKMKQPQFIYISDDFKDNGDIIVLGDDIFIDKTDGSLLIQGQKLKIGNFVSTHYDTNKNELIKNIQTLDNSADLNVIYMKEYNRLLVLDNSIFNSMFIQLFVLENYDKSIYEKIILTPLSKVYRLKI